MFHFSEIGLLLSQKNKIKLKNCEVFYERVVYVAGIKALKSDTIRETPCI
jgi:hypothetical protein